MARDHFATLGLTPGDYAPVEIERQFHRLRGPLVATLTAPGRHAAARAELEALYVAYRALSRASTTTPTRSNLPIADDATHPSRVRAQAPEAELRELILASVEDGLLRHSRRQAIIEHARALGLGEFQAQLYIAQTLYGGADVLGPSQAAQPRRRQRTGPAVARVAAAGVLALAVFLALLRWSGV
ncbi:MAG: hypothetical protein IPM13_14560 [Phycisphaerales bacterium]|nr:hypothetical protein [Phycisphaerales bacterium]